jgi:HD-like signal output (HDOD) protein
MVRVLFVDKEASELAALHRQLRSECGEWETTFVATPHLARLAIDDRAPDVVVVDLAPPEMDGVKLLREIEKRRPDAIRIVTSAQPKHRSYVDSIGVAHQFLDKPLAPGALKDAITRAQALRRWVARPEVASAVRQLGPPPRLPRIYRALTQAIQREASLSEIGALLGSDPTLTARLLQVANSAYFAPSHPITSTELAAAFLGLDMLRPIILVEGLGGEAAIGPSAQARMQAIWRHSIDVSATAQLLARHERLSTSEVASASSLGVLHDLGAILLARRHDPIDVGNEREPADAVERARYGLAHTDAGACIAIAWGLPDDVVEVVASHHDPHRFAMGRRPTAGLLVAAACAFADAGEAAECRDPAAIERLRAALDARGLADRLETWRSLAERLLQPVAPHRRS